MSNGKKPEKREPVQEQERAAPELGSEELESVSGGARRSGYTEVEWTYITVDPKTGDK